MDAVFLRLAISKLDNNEGQEILEHECLRCKRFRIANVSLCGHKYSYVQRRASPVGGESTRIVLHGPEVASVRLTAAILAQPETLGIRWQRKRLVPFIGLRTGLHV